MRFIGGAAMSAKRTALSRFAFRVSRGLCSSIAVEGVTLDAPREARCFLPVMRFLHRSSTRSEYVEGNALFAQEFLELRRGRAVDRVRKLARLVVDLLDPQVPDYAHFRATSRREHVGIRHQSQMVWLANLLDIVLYHQASADDLNVDRHSTAVGCRRRSGRTVRGRACLIFRVG